MRRFLLFLTSLLLLASCSKSKKMGNTTHTYAIRLKPGEDLRAGIEKIVKEKNIKAGWIVTCAGSLTNYTIRFANQPEGATGSGHFEIVSLGGTLSVNGSHIHLSISDSTGKTIGGHLLAGCKVYTTAEIIIQATDKYSFEREKDGTTPWEELQVKETN